MKNDSFYMKKALLEAHKAKDRDEVPIGAVLVDGGKIIARAFNLREKEGDPCGHAELLAIRKACKKKKDWRLSEATLYVTLEPCVMCSGVILQTRIKRVCFGTRDPKGGAVVSLYRLLEDPRFNHQVEIKEGILGRECQTVLKEFFRNLRFEWRDVRVVEGARLESV